MFSIISAARKVTVELNFEKEMPPPEQTSAAAGAERAHSFIAMGSQVLIDQRPQRSKQTKVKNLCQFFEDIIQKNQVRRNTYEKQNRASCPARIEKRALAPGSFLKSAISALNLDKCFSEECSVGRKYATLPKRARSLDVLISGPAHHEIIPEEKEGDFSRDNSTVEECIDELIQSVVEIETQDNATSTSGVIGSQEIYKDILPPRPEDE